LCAGDVFFWFFCGVKKANATKTTQKNAASASGKHAPPRARDNSLKTKNGGSGPFGPLSRGDRNLILSLDSVETSVAIFSKRDPPEFRRIIVDIRNQQL
jgi:hypothetical protein